MLLACFFAVVCVALYKVSENAYMQKAEKKLCLSTVIFGRDRANIFFGRFLSKTLFTDKNIEPSMNATSYCVSTAKGEFGCQKIKLGTLAAIIKVWHNPCQK